MGRTARTLIVVVAAATATESGCQPPAVNPGWSAGKPKSPKREPKPKNPPKKPPKNPDDEFVNPPQPGPEPEEDQEARKYAPRAER